MNYEEVRATLSEPRIRGRVGFGTNSRRSRHRYGAVLARQVLASRFAQRRGRDGPILEILAASRGAGVPVFFTTMAFDPNGAEAAGPVGRKLLHSSDQRALERDSGLTDLGPRLERRPNEILIEKQRASAFWGTPFQAYLTARKVDTLIITGCSTSGCVRSTAESAHNVGLHTIVAQEAVGDRSPVAHACNLIDIDMRFADVVPTRLVKQNLSRPS